MTLPSVLEALSAGEGPSIEFASDPRDFEHIARAVVAFLNADGGAVFCGVDERGNIKEFRQRPETLSQELELRLKKLISPSALFSVTVDELEGKPFLTVDVPKGYDAPYLVGGVIWVRQGPDSKPADATTLRELLRQLGELPQRWERRISLTMGRDDLDVDEVRAAVRDIEDNKRLSFTDPKDDLAVLSDLSVWNPQGFTQAADVLFSKRPAQRNPQCRVQFVQFREDKTSNEYLDYKWLEGPLVRTCRQVFDLLAASNSVRARFEPGNLQRTDRPAYSIDALREGVVNAFVHRDYTSYSGGLKISVYPHRIEIWNSGRLPKELSVEALGKEHPSIPVNPDLAFVFYGRGLMERTGRGAEKLMEACRSLGAKSPEWKDEPSGVTLTIYSAAAPLELNARQKILLAALASGSVISVADYLLRFAVGLTDRQARRDLAELDRAGLLIKVGQGRLTVYERTEKPGQE